jgi:Flp pilus assembly protein TadB
MPKSKSSDLGKQEIKSSQAVKIQKNDFDTSVEGLLKLVLIIVLALLILGLINMLLGSSLLNLLVLLLLIYLIWVYLF